MSLAPHTPYPIQAPLATDTPLLLVPCHLRLHPPRPSLLPQLRFLCINMVLNTDMTEHFNLLGRFQALPLATPAAWTLQQWSTVFEMLVHLADLANPSRPRPYAVSWAEKVITEFVGQVGEGGFGCTGCVCVGGGRLVESVGEGWSIWVGHLTSAL